jgi:putative transposase
MSHTYVSHLMHVVFSTKERRDMIPAEIQERLWSFIGGIARKNGFKTVAVGGTPNHIHVLISLTSTIPLAKAVQLLKGGSSKWLNENIESDFEWQQGYGAFSVSISQVPHTIAYINSQSEHHRRRNFDQEFVAFLKKHCIEYDPRYVFG